MLRNSEILFLYEAVKSNPNGDPDNENKPRMDWKTGRNLVSDVRLKRYIRDYFEQVKGMDIFVKKVDGVHVDATQRAKIFAEKIRKGSEKEITLDDLLKHFIDIRLFGITLPIKDPKKGTSITLTGPVQFTWGYSLNKVELLDSPTITSVFSGAKEGGGTFGKDWRVKYSLIAFYGRLNRHNAEVANLKEEDVQLLDEAIWNSINTQTNTRTKIGQAPLFYMRVEMKEGSDSVIGDLRRFVSISPVEGLESRYDYVVDMSKLSRVINNHPDVDKVYIRAAGDLHIEGLDIEKAQIL